MAFEGGDLEQATVDVRTRNDVEKNVTLASMITAMLLTADEAAIAT